MTRATDSGGSVGVLDLDAYLCRLALLVVDEIEARELLGRSSVSPPRWLTTREAAEYVGMHVSELQRAASYGAVPHEQDAPGCALRFRVEDLDEWIRQGRPGMPRRRRRAPVP